MTYYDEDTQKDMKAVEEPLSEEATLRLQLARYDELFCTVGTHMTDAEWQPFMTAQDDIYNSPDEKYHMLFDLLDTERKENARLTAALQEIAKDYPLAKSHMAVATDQKIISLIALGVIKS